MFPFIRFTNWKQAKFGNVGFLVDSNVSIHTLHELEARLYDATGDCKPPNVSIHTLHELEARGGRYNSNQQRRNWLKVSIHTLHELEASFVLTAIVSLSCASAVSIHTLHELEASSGLVNQGSI